MMDRVRALRFATGLLACGLSLLRSLRGAVSLALNALAAKSAVKIHAARCTVLEPLGRWRIQMFAGDLLSTPPDWAHENWAERVDICASLLFTHGYITATERMKIARRLGVDLAQAIEARRAEKKGE